MASGPETPGLACLMFSIPERLPTPAPAWEPGSVGRRRRKAALSAGGPRTGPSSEEARRAGQRCSELGAGTLDCRRPQQGLERGSGSLPGQQAVGGRECLSSRSTGSGRGAGLVGSS